MALENGTPAVNPFELIGPHHLHLGVEDMRSVLETYVGIYGYQLKGVYQPGNDPTRASYHLNQGRVNLILEPEMSGNNATLQNIIRGGNGFESVGLQVPDASKAFHTALHRGAEARFLPEESLLQNGSSVRASTVHLPGSGRLDYRFVSYHPSENPSDDYLFIPGFRAITQDEIDRLIDGIQVHDPVFPDGILDHVVINVPEGEMRSVVQRHGEILGFEVLAEFGTEDVGTEDSGLRSIVTRNPNTEVSTGIRTEGITLAVNVNEPDLASSTTTSDGRYLDQIWRFLDDTGQPGLQHVAIQTRDAFSAVRKLNERGIQTLPVDQQYYDETIPLINETLIARNLSPLSSTEEAALRSSNLLVDVDQGGLLFQTFTLPINSERPGEGPFYEIIQRGGKIGGAESNSAYRPEGYLFGGGNFGALLRRIQLRIQEETSME